MPARRERLKHSCIGHDDCDIHYGDTLCVGDFTKRLRGVIMEALKLAISVVGMGLTLGLVVAWVFTKIVYCVHIFNQASKGHESI